MHAQHAGQARGAPLLLRREHVAEQARQPRGRRRILAEQFLREARVLRGRVEGRMRRFVWWHLLPEFSRADSLLWSEAYRSGDERRKQRR